jgi:hypothetical protein
MSGGGQQHWPKSSKGKEASSAAATANAAACSSTTNNNNGDVVAAGISSLGSNLGGRQRRRRDSPIRKQKAPAKGMMSLARLEDCVISPYLGAMSNAGDAANLDLMDKLRKVDDMGYREFVEGDPRGRKLCLDPEAGYKDAEASVKGTFLDAAATQQQEANDAAACSGRTNTFRTDLASALGRQGFKDEEIDCVLSSFKEEQPDDETASSGSLSTASTSKQRESAFKVYAIPTRHLFKACLAKGQQMQGGRGKGGGAATVDLPISSAYLASLAENSGTSSISIQISGSDIEDYWSSLEDYAARASRPKNNNRRSSSAVGSEGRARLDEIREQSVVLARHMLSRREGAGGGGSALDMMT